MARTVQDLATRSMKLLGLLEASEEAASEDFGDIQRVYVNRFADLGYRQMTYWPLEEIPEEAFEYVARIIADEIAPTYGKSAPIEIDENGSQVSMGVRGIRGLRRLMSKEKSGLPVAATFF